MSKLCLWLVYDYLHFQDVVNKVGRVLSQWIYLGGVKAFADGSLGSNSALFYEVTWNTSACVDISKLRTHGIVYYLN